MGSAQRGIRIRYKGTLYEVHAQGSWRTVRVYAVSTRVIRNRTRSTLRRVTDGRLAREVADELLRRVAENKEKVETLATLPPPEPVKIKRASLWFRFCHWLKWFRGWMGTA